MFNRLALLGVLAFGLAACGRDPVAGVDGGPGSDRTDRWAPGDGRPVPDDLWPWTDDGRPRPRDWGPFTPDRPPRPLDRPIAPPDHPWKPDSPSPVTEKVTCVFSGSSTIQSCYASSGAGCTGTGSCTATVSGIYGQKLDWKSTCGGYASSYLDGKAETVVFSCGTTAVTETVTCLFSSSSYQSCWSSHGGCGGVGSCQAKVSGTKGATLSWSSTCGPGSLITTIDGVNESVSFKCSAQVSETVTCTFKGSSTSQVCSSSKGGGCSGVSSCQATVSGIMGEQVSWKSTCGSNVPTTTIDGKNESVVFACPQTPVKETVTCLFKGSTTFQTCTSSKGTCQGLLGCTIQVSGTKGEQVSWKSSCGGYAMTIMDGVDESASFACGWKMDGGPWPPPPPPWPVDAGAPTPWP